MNPLFVSSLLCNFIALVVSQEPLNITRWAQRSETAGNTNCETISGYDYENSLSIMFGGKDNPNAGYTFDSATDTYTTNLNALTDSITAIGQSFTQFQDDSVIYFLDGTDVKGIDPADNTIATYATLSAAITQDRPALCVHNERAELFVVGSGEVETCLLDSTSPPVCTGTFHNEITSYEEVACAAYGDWLFLFGGENADGAEFANIVRCNATNPNEQSTCRVLSDTALSQARRSIVSVPFGCFGEQYTALIGGATNLAGAASNVVDIFDLVNQTIVGSATMLNTARWGHAAVYDPVLDDILVFGGQDGTTCIDSVEMTGTTMQGICVTMQPTRDPTRDPTFMPTSDPTEWPTADPTEVPSMDPSGAPTMEPTMTPSMGPSEATSGPSGSPTGTPSMSDEQDLDSRTAKPTQKPYSPDVNDVATGPTVYVIIIVLLLIICCIICFCAWWYEKKEKKDKAAPVVVVAASGGDAYATQAEPEAEA